MDKAILNRLPSAFIDGFSGYLIDAINKEKGVYEVNTELYLHTADNAARGRALEAKGRQLAYSDVLNKIKGDRDGR